MGGSLVNPHFSSMYYKGLLMSEIPILRVKFVPESCMVGQRMVNRKRKQAEQYF